MKIECILKREGGTKINLPGDNGDVEYYFKEQPDGAHVAEVTDKAHIKRLLSIPEGYEIYDPAAPKKNQTLLGSSVHPATFEIGDKVFQLGDVVAIAFKDSCLTEEDWNSLSDDARADMIDEALDKLAAENGGIKEGDDAEINALREQYQAKFGKAPHHAMKAETIKAKLAE